uniref:D-aspartate oxidase-like n=1 Tax=Styela clava TaxID=7725 RepID=UPI00193A6BA6|nr:D-aspartate oxidase-like [Styela clava]
MANLHSAPLSFCVLGAGISGLSSAYCLAKNYPSSRVTVVYEEGTPNTTSNHGFGILSLRSLDELDSADTIRFTKATASHFANIISQSPQLAAEIGLSAMPAYLTYDRKQGSPEQDVFPGGPTMDTFAYFMEISEHEKSSLSIDSDGLKYIFERDDIEPSDLVVYKAGTWVIDNHSYLPWLKKELELMAARGDISSVNFIQRRVSNFSELLKLEDFHFIVNCSGLGSEYLVPDGNMIPIRGQYLLVKPNATTDLRYGGHTFICPKPGRVALGSVYQKGRRETSINHFDKEDILRRCCALNPQIRNSEIIGESVGIRPGRYGGPRVELDRQTLRSSRGNDSVPIIHNYGHGAKGILQHWGCALEVVKLAESLTSIKSKL